MEAKSSWLQKNDSGEEVVVCPFCGCENVHFGNSVRFDSDDDYAASDLIGVRGSACVVMFYCEYGCVWRLTLGFHKGSTIVETNFITKQDMSSPDSTLPR